MALQVELVQHGMDWGDAAGWTQAAATAVALWLALRQGWAASRRERARDRAAAVAAYTIINNASQTVVHMYGRLVHVQGRNKARVAQQILDEGHLTELAASLNAIDATRLPQDIFVSGLSAAQTSIREFRQALQFLASEDVTKVFLSDPYPAVENIQQAQSMLVEPLVLLDPRAKQRAFWQRVQLQWAELRQFRETG